MLCEGCIKRATGTKTPNGITITLTGTFNTPPSTLEIGNYKLTLKSITKSSTFLQTLTYSTSFDEYVIGSAHFKVIPASVYSALYNYGMVSKLTSDLSPISSPSSVFIKITENEDDVYAQNTGFTPNEIFSTFGIEVIYPPALNYNITELIIRNGISVSALVHSVFPIPGTLNFVDDGIIEFTISPEIFNLVSYKNGVSYNMQEKEYHISVTGMQSEPRNIVYEGSVIETYGSDDGSIEVEVVKNIFGKVYGIVREEYVIEDITSSIPDLEKLLSSLSVSEKIE